MERALERQGTSAPDGRKAPSRSAAILTGWGRYPILRAPELRPATLAGVPACLGGPHLPRGLGRSYGDAGLPAEGHAAVNARQTSPSSTRATLRR